MYKIYGVRVFYTKYGQFRGERVNPFTAINFQLTLTDFTLSNARRFTRQWGSPVPIKTLFRKKEGIIPEKRDDPIRP